MHASATGGHFGQKKMVAKFQERFHSPALRSDVERWVVQCDVCATRRGPAQRWRGKLQQYRVGAPSERIAIDITDPLPTTETGNRYILVLSDYFTRWVEAYPIENMEATTVADTLVREFVFRFGVPRRLHSDEEAKIESRVFQGMCRLLGIEKTRTTPFHDQSDGLVVRLNRTLGNIISSSQQHDWDEVLLMAMMAHRSSRQESTDQTLYLMLFGREIDMHVDVVYERLAPEEPPEDTTAYEE